MGRKDVKLCLCVYLNPCLNLPTTGDVSFHFQCNYPYAALTLAEAHEIHQGSSREDSTTFLIMRQIIEHRSPTNLLIPWPISSHYPDSTIEYSSWNCCLYPPTICSTNLTKFSSQDQNSPPVLVLTSPGTSHYNNDVV